MSDALCLLSARELADGYMAGTFSPVEVVSAYLTRIRDLNVYYHAYLDVANEGAMQAAEESTRRLADGTARPLEGLPISLKDLIGIEGEVCTAGSATRLRTMATETASVVERLTGLGAIVLGKVHTIEFAFGSWGVNQHLGAPRNPWSNTQHRTPGGSSSGSGVSVAARLAPWSIGTDTGGSVRMPAGFNGLVGLKGTFGRISAHGVVPMCPSLDSVGVIARTVHDAAWLFQLLQGADARDPATQDLPPADILPDIEKGAKGLRVGRVDISPWHNDGLLTDEVAASYENAVQAMAKAGAEIIDMVLPVDLTRVGQHSPVMSYEVYRQHGATAEDRDAVMDEGVRRRILGGAAVSTSAYDAAMQERKRERAVFDEALSGVDTLLMPTTPCAAIQMHEVDDSRTAAVLTRFVNQLGLCAIALPCGFTQEPEPMPLSVQFVARACQEAAIVRAARSLEAALSLDMTPPLLHTR